MKTLIKVISISFFTCVSGFAFAEGLSGNYEITGRADNGGATCTRNITIAESNGKITGVMGTCDNSRGNIDGNVINDSKFIFSRDTGVGVIQNWEFTKTGEGQWSGVSKNSPSGDSGTGLITKIDTTASNNQAPISNTLNAFLYGLQQMQKHDPRTREAYAKLFKPETMFYRANSADTAYGANIGYWQYVYSNPFEQDEYNSNAKIEKQKFISSLFEYKAQKPKEIEFQGYAQLNYDTSSGVMVISFCWINKGGFYDGFMTCNKPYNYAQEQNNPEKFAREFSAFIPKDQFMDSHPSRLTTAVNNKVEWYMQSGVEFKLNAEIAKNLYSISKDTIEKHRGELKFPSAPFPVVRAVFKYHEPFVKFDDSSIDYSSILGGKRSNLSKINSFINDKDTIDVIFQYKIKEICFYSYTEANPTYCQSIKKD